MSEVKKTYAGWKESGLTYNQNEVTEQTDLLAEDGTLLVKGAWARHNLFTYDRYRSKPTLRRKEWDFYQMSDGNYIIQISIANISIGGYASATLIDLHAPNEKGLVATSMALWLGGKNKVILPACGDRPNVTEYKKGKFELRFETHETYRTLYFKGPSKGKTLECKFRMDIPENLENITTVLPFDGYPTRYFMTTKQNCMPCEGTFAVGEKIYSFDKQNTFCCLDWGRVNTPYKLCWYWGNGAHRMVDENGKEHIFGFEITWAIGNETGATETCLFWDGKAHKIGAVDVEVFPKPDKYMQPWHFVSEDGRFDMTMTPYYDNHNDTNALILRMHSHQVYGKWNGTVVLDDDRKIEIKDMVAFCEYVENRW